MTPPSPARVVLVDDHAVVRRGLRQILEGESDFQVCAEGGTVAEGFSAVEVHQPSLLVTDLALEDRGGLELVALVRRYFADLPVLVVSMYEEALFARRALAAGARGYVSKRRAALDVVAAARALLDGRTFFPDSLADALTTPPASPADPVAALSDREFEVLLLLGQGYAPRHIADTLCLSVSTVEAYRERMKQKLGLGSSPMLTRYAVQWCKDRVTI